MENIFKEFISEFIGTTILMVFGLSASATSVLSHAGTPIFPGIGYAFGAIIAIFFCGPISGAHINPAVTFAFCIIQKTDWRKCVLYFVAQYFGAFLGVAIIYGIYHESIHAFDQILSPNATEMSVATAGIFVTFPAPNISLGPAVADQVLSTGLLVFAILFIGDESCFQTSQAIQALSTGFAIFSFVLGFNFNCGAILNPARDLAPRVFLSIFGQTHLAFHPLNGHYWWLVAIIGTHAGAIIGAILYLLLAKMRTSYIESTQQTLTVTPVMPAMANEQDLIYQKGMLPRIATTTTSGKIKKCSKSANHCITNHNICNNHLHCYNDNNNNNTSTTNTSATTNNNNNCNHCEECCRKKRNRSVNNGTKKNYPDDYFY